MPLETFLEVLHHGVNLILSFPVTFIRALNVHHNSTVYSPLRPES